MSKEEFNTVQELGKTREALDKPIGMIMLSLTPEIMNGETRSALIASQGAVRAANIADKMVAIAADSSKIEPKDFVRHDDPLFKWINGEKDSEIVKRGQNLWLSAQMSLNYQILSTQDVAALPLNTAFTDSVSASAAVILNEAAAFLAMQNQNGGADKLKVLAKTIAPETKADVLDDKAAGDVKFTRLTLDKPLGDLMVVMLNIDTEVKNALLMGQAAVRALNLVDKAEAFIKDSQSIVDAHKAAGTTIEPKDSGAVAFDDQIFKFVGSPRDPIGLQQAQGLWMGAQMYLNYQIGTVKRVIDGGERTAPLAAEFGEGFKQSAANILQQAADTLAAKGFVKASEKMSALADAVAEKIDAKTAVPASHAVATVLHFEPAVAGNDALAAKLRQLIDLTKTAPKNGGGTSPAPAA